MSKRCASCGHSNDNSRIFCSACGDPLDVELRLIQELEKRKHDVSETEWHSHEEKDDDDDYEAPAAQNKKEKGSALPILLVVLAVVAAAAWLFLK